MDWYPDNDESLIYRGRVRFATGRAAKVAGMRWFRDDTGRDITAELQGWPAGPVYTPRGDGTAKTNRTLGGIGKGLVVVAAMAISAVSNANPDVSLGDAARPADPAHEVEDFPVMVAAPGTLARTLPYHLDPDRRPKHYFTDLVVTERRLLVLGVPQRSGPVPADVLWEQPRTAVAAAVKHAFATNGSDLSLVFGDGSRARLSLLDGPSETVGVVAELCPAARVQLSGYALAMAEKKKDSTTLEHFWEAVAQDNGTVLAQRVLVHQGKQVRGKSQMVDATKWVRGPEQG